MITRTKIFLGLGLSAFLAMPSSFANVNSDRPESGIAGENRVNRDADIETTRRIRELLVADDSMSLSASNVTILTHGGLVTLTGTVKSQSEKDAVEDKAMAVAGSRAVNNRLTIAE